jgi:predicted TIM-barrel fold metal-dependent hydrolase
VAHDYTILSADSHLDLNPDLWNQRVPAKYKEYAPRRIRLESGDDAIQIGDSKPQRIGLTKSVGVAHKDMAKQVPTYETAAGTGSPEQRVREQDRDGIKAEVMFSMIGAQMIRPRVKDDDAYAALTHAYNTFLAEEYQPAAPGRLFPLGLIPTCGLDYAMAELEYVAKAGLKGAFIDSFPSGKGHPSPEDDRFWAAALDLRMPLSKHGAHRLGGGPADPPLTYPRDPGAAWTRGNDPFEYLFRFCGENGFGAMQLACGGVFDRFPSLQIYWAETMIGWLDYSMWQIDDSYERYWPMFNELFGVPYLERKPSDYLRDNNLWGFLHDPVGVRHRGCIGADRVMWGTDFAHAASEWPNSLETVETAFAGVPEDEKHLMLAGNAVRFFHLDE